MPYGFDGRPDGPGGSERRASSLHPAANYLHQADEPYRSLFLQ
jgi:hypothetical protein